MPMKHCPQLIRLSRCLIFSSILIFAFLTAAPFSVTAEGYRTEFVVAELIGVQPGITRRGEPLVDPKTPLIELYDLVETHTDSELEIYIVPNAAAARAFISRSSDAGVADLIRVRVHQNTAILPLPDNELLLISGSLTLHVPEHDVSSFRVRYGEFVVEPNSGELRGLLRLEPQVRGWGWTLTGAVDDYFAAREHFLGRFGRLFRERAVIQDLRRIEQMRADGIPRGFASIQPDGSGFSLSELETTSPEPDLEIELGELFHAALSFDTLRRDLIASLGQSPDLRRTLSEELLLHLEQDGGRDLERLAATYYAARLLRVRPQPLDPARDSE